MRYYCTIGDNDFIIATSSINDEISVYSDVGDEQCNIVLTKQDAIAFARGILALCGESE